MSTEFTDKQKLFLDALYEEAKGDVRKAMTIAGYSKTTPMSAIYDALAEEIVKRGYKFMAANVPKAALGMVDIIDDPNQLGVANRISAAKEVMDRAGLVKKDKLEVSGEGISGIFLLPAKNRD